MAEIAGLRDISSAQASFDVSLRRGGRVHVAGHLSARIGQTCVVTLDPIENDIDEDIDVIFAPAEQIAEAGDDLTALDEVTEGELPEPPEPIVDGIIDLGRLATDVLYLAIDPYPRKAGAVFEPQVAEADPEDHPFAALKAFKTAGKPPRSEDEDDK
jgi:hypothetical protein